MKPKTFQPPTVPLPPPKILLVEDEELIRGLMATLLTRAGFDVSIVADGEQAWNESRRNHYDLVVTDKQMPRLSGLELIGRMRHAHMDLPVILVTGSFVDEQAPGFTELQISALIAKPFDSCDFLNAVRKVLKTSPDAPDNERNAYKNITPMPVCPRAGMSRVVCPQVLIADDDDLVRGSLAAVLESEGYEVVEACDGREAVNNALKHKPDLVLLDLNMPHTDGWVAFNQMDRVTPVLPVIIITARPNQYPEAARVGVDAFMEKPLNIASLMGAVKRLTSEEENRHVRRITNRSFVTQLLVSTNS